MLCSLKFQDDLYDEKLLLRIDSKSVKEVLQEDVQNLESKHNFAG